jgi:hypothetical protein
MRGGAMPKIVHDIEIWSSHELTAWDANESGQFFKLSDGIDQIPAYYMSSSVKKTQIYDIYLTTYDLAVPQDWFDEYWRRWHRPPDAVWDYSDGSLFGKPVFWDDILRRFVGEVISATAEPG